jgi:hypothetical protein
MHYLENMSFFKTAEVIDFVNNHPFERDKNQSFAKH